VREAVDAAEVFACGTPLASSDPIRAVEGTMQIRAMLFSVCFAAGAAQAGVIAGPPLPYPDGNWAVAGLSFTALQDTKLHAFQFINQGLVDTVVLTDASGTVLHSVTVPAGRPNARINGFYWSLSAGQQYWLLQTADTNAKFAIYEGPLTANADIAMVQTGTFGDTIPDAVNNVHGWTANGYWTAFESLTTGVPEPASLALFATALAGAGVLRRRKK
jgi:hypothetical protein